MITNLPHLFRQRNWWAGGTGSKPYRHDGPDGAEVIAWTAAQDWCSGDVATYGASYGGRIQWLTALEQPPALRAMVCVVTPSDPFVENPTGLPTPMHINWYRFTDGRMPQFREDVDWMAGPLPAPHRRDRRARAAHLRLV